MLSFEVHFQFYASKGSNDIKDGHDQQLPGELQIARVEPAQSRGQWLVEFKDAKCCGRVFSKGARQYRIELQRKKWMDYRMPMSWINLTDLGHEAGVWEAQEAASEQHDARAGGDEACLPRLCLPDGRGGREVEQHQEVSHHARHQPYHQDRLPPLLGRDTADESEYDSTCRTMISAGFTKL